MDRSETVDQLANEIEADARLDVAENMRAFLTSIPQLRRYVVAAAIRALTARKYYFSKEKKEMVFEPDSGTQMKAVAWLAAYQDGLPLQSTVNLNVDPLKAGAAFSMADAMATSPALRDHIRKELEAAERKAIAV